MRGHLHENIVLVAGTIAHFRQPQCPSPCHFPGWGERGFTLTGPVHKSFIFRQKGVGNKSKSNNKLLQYQEPNYIAYLDREGMG